MSRTRPQLQGRAKEGGIRQRLQPGIVSREGDLSERGGYSAFAVRRYRGRSNNSACYAFYTLDIFPREEGREAGPRGLMEAGIVTRFGDLDLQLREDSFYQC